MERLQKEVAWFVEKNDYRNKDKDWGNSADSIQRGMQKGAGGYPAMKCSGQSCKLRSFGFMERNFQGIQKRA